MASGQIMVASLAACGGSSAPAASAAPAAPAVPAAPAASAAAPAANADPFAALGDFTMVVGHAQPEGNPRFVSMEKFAADVAEKTNGH